MPTRPTIPLRTPVSDRRRRIAPFIALGVAVVMGALFVVLAQSDTSGNDSVSSFLVGKPAPAATGTTLDGEAFDLSRRKGSWVVLNFFDPSCRPCVHEHPELVTFTPSSRRSPTGPSCTPSSTVAATPTCRRSSTTTVVVGRS